MQLRQPKLFPPPQSGRAARNDDRLTPNLTNIFLALVPKTTAETEVIARLLEDAIRSEWKSIASKCWKFCQAADVIDQNLEARFHRQRDRFLAVAWQVTPLADAVSVRRMLRQLPLSPETLQMLEEASDADLPFAASAARTAWQLDAARQVRNFMAWKESAAQPGQTQQKDSLTGREEHVAGGRVWWEKQIRGKGYPWTTLFRERQKSEYFGAITLIKRVWHLAYLEPEHKLFAGHRREPVADEFPFPSTFHIATHDPAKHEDDPSERTPEEESDRVVRYFAVLAMDGDHMGQWMAGERFGQPTTPELQRDFSVRLSRFGLRCARPIVEACDGRLIYAGGDDVIALLPSDTALACAGFLRTAFRGSACFVEPLANLATVLLSRHKSKADGKCMGQNRGEHYVSRFLQRAADGTLFDQNSAGPRSLRRLDLGENLELPGPVADVSAGLAIAHFKEPLQDVVRAAQHAESRAKNNLGRSALAVALIKHSGETVAWGAKWDGGGLRLLNALQEGVACGFLSGRFPHRLAEELAKYRNPPALPDVPDVAEFAARVDEILKLEFAAVLRRQRGLVADSASANQFRQRLADDFAAYLQSLADEPPQSRLCAVIGLCQTVAFFTKPSDVTEIHP
ncbi:MAG: type III-B CRISPR-associated protein Cas10/Cmr2 [Verrucomicrobiota bacterium]